MPNSYLFNNIETSSVLRRLLKSTFDLSQPYFIIHDYQDFEDELVTDEMVREFENGDWFEGDNSDSCDIFAKTIGFNVVEYSYNLRSFGSCISKRVLSYVFINPYVHLASIPVPPVPGHIVTIIDKLDQFYVDKEYDPAFEVYWEEYKYGPATEGDYFIWDYLPGGWQSKDFTDVYSKHNYFRPQPSMAVPEHLANNVVLLHPLLQRPLTKEEIEHLYTTSFDLWVANQFNPIQLTADPIPFYSFKIDLLRTHLPSRYKLPMVPSPFIWQNYTRPKNVNG